MKAGDIQRLSETAKTSTSTPTLTFPSSLRHHHRCYYTRTEALMDENVCMATIHQECLDNNPVFEDNVPPHPLTPCGLLKRIKSRTPFPFPLT